MIIKRDNNSFSPATWLTMLTVFLFMLSPASQAQQNWSEIGSEQQEKLTIPINSSKLLQFNRDIEKVSVGNPSIADILIFDAKRLYVLGKNLGSTNVLIFDNNDEILATIYVEIIHDLKTLKKNLYDLLPNESINVTVSKGTIVLSGQVSSIAESESAVELARNFLPGEGALAASGGGEGRIRVINLLTVGGAQQVMLEVKVAEVSRQVMKRMDIDFNVIDPGGEFTIGAVSGGASFPEAVFDGAGRIPVFPLRPGPPFFTPVGPAVTEFAPSPLTIQDQGTFLSFLNENVLFNAILDIAKENGLAKILAEPTLTTISGQRARFISGGEIPIPVADNDGITIEYKEFGVGLEFVPVVLNENRINLDLNMTVSQLTDTFNVTINPIFTNSQFVVPSLTKRSATTTVELADGQTLGIAGLINEELRENVSKFPGLGDIPVLGAMFRSEEFVKGQTELVIFVTPHFAKPIDRNKVELPTDYFIEPTDAEFYLLGRLQGRDPDAYLEADLSSTQINWEFGHEL